MRFKKIFFLCLGAMSIFQLGCTGVFGLDNLELYLKNSLQTDSWLVPLGFSFLAGFLTSLSPCIYPLIPITLSIMGTRSYESHLHGFLIALTYVMGMAFLYTILGASFASLGLLAGSLMQSPVIILIISLIFILLAFSMFGVFNFVVSPKFITQLSKLGGSGYKGAFVMGLVAGVIAAPCTGPVLGFILTLIAFDQELIFGTALMLFFSLGVGVPFLILGTFSSALAHMPKSGPWMNKIKYLFGSAILGVGFYYLLLVFPQIKQLFLMPNILNIIFVSLFLGLLILFFGFKFLFLRLIGVILLSQSMMIILVIQGENLNYENINITNWHVISKSNYKTNFENLLLQAQEQNKLILIDFYADWCVACKKLEKETFSHPQVQKILQNYFLIKIDATHEFKKLDYIYEKFNIISLPSIIIYKNKNNFEKILGFVSWQEFLEKIKF